MRTKTMTEKHELKMAKKDYRLSVKTEGHQRGRQELLKALSDGLASCNFGSLKVHVPSTLK